MIEVRFVLDTVQIGLIALKGPCCKELPKHECQHQHHCGMLVDYIYVITTITDID